MIAVPTQQVIARRRLVIPRPGGDEPAGQLDLFPGGDPYVQLYSRDGTRIITATATTFGGGFWLHDQHGHLRLCCMILADGRVSVAEIDESGDQHRLVPQSIGRT